MPQVYTVGRKGRAVGPLSNTSQIIIPHSPSLDFRHDEPFSLDILWYPTGSTQNRSWLSKAGFGVATDPNARLRISVVSQNGDGLADLIVFSTSITNVQQNRWHHATISKSAGYGDVNAYSCFLNGVQSGVFSSSATLAPTSDTRNAARDFYIGNEGGVSIITGYIAAYRVYKHQMTLADHIKSRDKEGAMRVVPNVVLEYLFNGGEDNNFIDTSGYGNVGARSGLPLSNVDAYSL
jgi:hypothetical protein